MVSDTDFFALVEGSLTLSHGSKVAYIKQLKSLKKALDGEALADIILRPSVVEHLDAPLATRVAYTNAVNSLFKREAELQRKTLDFVSPSVRAEWADLLKRLHEDRSEIVDKNIRSKKEEMNWVSADEWKEMDNTLSTSERGSQAQLLVAFHSQIPPPRGGDLAQVRICSDEKECPEGNIIIVSGSNPRLIIRDHKTRRKYGAIVVKLPSSLEQDVIVSLKAQPRDYLFVNSHNEMYPTRDAFMTWKSNTFKRLFKRDVTTNIARREYATTEDMNAPLHQLKRSAEAMGHSIETHHAYRVVKPKHGGELHGGKRVTVSELVVGREYLFKFRDLDILFKGTVSGKEEPNDAHPGQVEAHLRGIEILHAAPAVGEDPEDVDYMVERLRHHRGWRITDRHYLINDNIHAHERFAAEAIGRVHRGIPAPMIGQIAEYLGHEGAIGDLVRQDIADKGREGDPRSVLRERSTTGLEMQDQPAARVRPREDEEDGDGPPARRQRQGGALHGGSFPYAALEVGDTYRFDYMYAWRHPEEIYANPDARNANDRVPVMFIGKVLDKIDRGSVVRVEDVTPAMRGIANANRREYRISMDEWVAKNNPFDIVNVGQIGRKYNGLEVANLGKVAEFLGLPGAEQRFVQENVADKGLPDQQPSLFREREGGELEGGGLFSSIGQLLGITQPEKRATTTIQHTLNPKDLQRMCEQAYALFNNMYPENVGKWDLIQQTPEDLLYRYGETFVVAVRGTQGSPTGLDWAANRTIPMNGLADTARCKKDLYTVRDWKEKYPYGDWYATGHSLGGAICDELLRAGLVREAYTFNPAVQTMDFTGQLPNRRIYARGDPLSQLFGRHTAGAVLQPAGSLAKELLTRISPTYFATNALSQHNLSAFDAHPLQGGMAVKEGCHLCGCARCS